MSDPTLAFIEIVFPPELWLAKVCQQYPSVQVEIQSFLPGRVQEGGQMVGNALMRIRDARIDAVLAEIREHPSLVAMFVLAHDPLDALVNVKTRDSWLLASLITSEAVLRFPVQVRWDGRRAVGTWVVTGLRDRVNHLLTLLEAKGSKPRSKTSRKSRTTASRAPSRPAKSKSSRSPSS